MKHIKWFLMAFSVILFVTTASLKSSAACYECQYLQNTKLCYSNWCSSGNDTGSKCCGNRNNEEEES